MCMGGGAPSPPAPAPPAPEAQDASVIAARDKERQLKRKQAGQTLLTSGQGVMTPATIDQKTLLGQ